MVDNKRSFVVTLNVKKGTEDHGHVYYKQDGQRFDYSCTIKMNVETTYHFTLMLRPRQILDSVSVHDSAVSLSEVKYEDDTSIYTFPFTTTGFQVTKHKLRAVLPVTLNVRQVGLLSLTLQVKFYGADDTNHATWGNALHHVDYECEMKPGRVGVDVMKEIYR